MSSKSLGAKGSKGVGIEEKEDDKYFDTSRGVTKSLSRLQIAGECEAKEDPRRGMMLQRNKSKKDIEVEREEDEEVDEEFNRHKAQVPHAIAPAKPSSVEEARVNCIRKRFKINWMNMSDAYGGTLLWESTTIGEDLARGGATEISASVPRSILNCRAVSRELNFTSGEQINKLRLHQRVMLSGRGCIEENFFVFGFVIPGSTNTWQQTIVAAPPDKMLSADQLSGRVVFETTFFDEDVIVSKYSTSAGYALFKVLKPDILDSVDLWKEFKSAEKASSVVKLKAFTPFENTTEAVVAATSIIDSSLDKTLKKFLKKHIINKELSDELAVADIKLGGLIKDKMDIQCVHNDGVNELFRGVRTQMDSLLSSSEDHAGAMKAMQLGLSHSLSRYKLKFSADKVDIMIVQAIGLLDDLDKEINMYAMRVREWYGWHFPEMAKIVNDNMFYAKLVLRMGMRINCKKCDFSDILGDEAMELTLKKVAETSMGTEISEADLLNVRSLCTQVVSLSEYRIQLFEYLRNRMAAIAPNLTIMVGELVGARLVAHAGSLINLAKQPASTIQILGAEKALFRALKTKHDTPKYGLIFHASLIGQAAPKNKGKISRLLAAKTALAIRVDALGDETGPTIAIDNRIKVENRIRQLEGGQKVSVGGKPGGGPSKYDGAAARALAPPMYNASSDMVVVSEKKVKKRKAEETAAAAEEEEEAPVTEKKKKAKGDVDSAGGDTSEKKKKKKKHAEEEE